MGNGRHRFLDTPRALQHRAACEIDGRAIPVIGFEDLLAKKLAAARDKDLLDVKHLSKRPKR